MINWKDRNPAINQNTKQPDDEVTNLAPFTVEPTTCTESTTCIVCDTVLEVGTECIALHASDRTRHVCIMCGIYYSQQKR